MYTYVPRLLRGLALVRGTLQSSSPTGQSPSQLISKLASQSVCSASSILNSLPYGVHLFLTWLEQQPHPVCVVVHREVCQPGPGVRVDDNLISLLDITDDVLSCHGVLVVVPH